MGLQNLEEVQFSLFMKFAWKLLTQSSLWANFFKVKYIKDKHVMLVCSRNGSVFWRSVVSMIPKVLNQST